MTLTAMKQLSTSVPDALYEKIRKAAEKDGRSISNLASYLLERGMLEWIATHGNPDDEGDRR
jgi:hypothetical protein